MDFAWVVDALRRGLRVTRKAWAGDPPMYLYRSKTLEGDDIVMKSNGTRNDFEWAPTAEQMLTVTDWEEYVDPKKEPKKADRIVCAISDISQFADDLAEGASEQLGIKVDKRDMLIAIVDAVIYADETGLPVKELVQNAYEKALKKAESDHV